MVLGVRERLLNANIKRIAEAGKSEGEFRLHCPHCGAVNELHEDCPVRDLNKLLSHECESCKEDFYVSVEVKYSTRKNL